jgi:hypothetical protein
MRVGVFSALLSVVLIGSPGAVLADRKTFELGMRALEKGNYAEAYCHWKPLAEQGNAEAQYHMGWLYANGNGLAVDPERALAWWTRAARQGFGDAEFAVGLAYTTGDGIERDLDEAVIWYLAAARRGNQDARDILIRLNGDPSLNLLENHPEVAQEPWFGRGAHARKDGINVRTGPGTDHAVVTTLARGARVRVVGHRSDWYMVVLASPGEGQVAWIYKSLVSLDGR